MSVSSGTSSLQQPWAINWRYAGPLLGIHLIALLGLVPWFFSWSGVLLCFISYVAVGMLGVNVGYHRLLTHRSFGCPLWVERTLAILGCCCGQDSPTYWVAVHRRHHHHSDDELDPHSPRRSFFWGHVGWMVLKSGTLGRGPLMDRYARDLRRDPFQTWLVKHDNWMLIMFASWMLFFAGGFGVAALSGSDIVTATRFGLSLVVWGCVIRTVLLWHMTWAVNSVTHLWGYRNYETDENSRNNLILGLMANGEGWHNNHHADPRSARHGHRWWEFDLAWETIRLMVALGLASNPRLPSPTLAARYNRSASRAAPDEHALLDTGPSTSPTP